MHDPDPGGRHDVRILGRHPGCARCGQFGRDLGRIECARPASAFHVRGGENGRALCGERASRWARTDGAFGGGAAADCPRCLAALAAMPPPGAHSFRAWGGGALCSACGEHACDPDALGPLCAPPSLRHAHALVHAAADPLDPAGPFLCDPGADPPPAAAARRAVLVRTGGNWIADPANCPDCLAAADPLPDYEAGVHDLRLFADGVICAACGTAAASEADAGGCPGGAPDALLRARRNGVPVTISGGAVHGPGAGCRYAQPFGDFWRKRRERGAAPARLRVTCRSCRRIAATAPRIAAA